MSMRSCSLAACLVATVCGWTPVLRAEPPAEESPIGEQAAQALRRACEFYRARVAVQGGYVWRYSEDLSLREGEGKVGDSTAWVQPPGTPTVGLAYLAAFEATGDEFYLEAARETAQALVVGQLRSGGWTYSIEFDPKERQRFAYRNEPEGRKRRNWSTLDDNTTQSALLCLMRIDKALAHRDELIHAATQFALDALLKAQFPTGGFPQGFQGPVESHPVQQASFPDSWPRSQPPNHDYWVFPTLNDNLLRDLIPVLLEAARIYEKDEYRQAALYAGEFLILAQLPDPQPGWAQQYDFDMRPTWARKFEPPAVTGSESQGAMETLLFLYRETGDRKYLEPLPRALEYFRRSRLPDGRLARFYELQTNKPLYFTRQYELTYRDDDLPTHYGFKVSDKLDRIAAEYERLKTLDLAELQRVAPAKKARASRELEAKVREVVAALDDQGRWTEQGQLRSHGGGDRRIIASETFVANVETLSRYLLATRPHE